MKRALIDLHEATIDFCFRWDDICPTREEFLEFLRNQPIFEVDFNDMISKTQLLSELFCHQDEEDYDIFKAIADFKNKEE